jgi:hypothetical protein
MKNTITDNNSNAIINHRNRRQLLSLQFIVDVVPKKKKKKKIKYYLIERLLHNIILVREGQDILSFA